MRLVVGLGNPGHSYRNTRHNIGFLTIERLAQRHGIVLKKQKYNSIFGEKGAGKEKVVLIKPQTFMNLSGESVGVFVRKFKVPLQELLVVCDDVNLDFGVLRLRQKGSAGGHHGLESIISAVKENGFPRLRIGIAGSNIKDLTNYVLEPFDKVQSKSLESVLDEACDTVDTWLDEGINKAMNKYNANEAQTYGAQRPPQSIGGSA